MIPPSDLAIVIPAFNEEKTIAAVINGVKHLGQVIVVDDGSSDNTAQVAEQAGAQAVRLERNRGYDYALYSGFSHASSLQKQWVMSMDADGQHRAEDVVALIAAMDKADYVLGYRSSSARLSEAVMRFVVKKLYGIEDILCGLKGFKMGLFHQCGQIMQEKTIGTGLAIVAARAGKTYMQVPITVNKRHDTPRIGRIVRANVIIFKGVMRALCVAGKVS